MFEDTEDKAKLLIRIGGFISAFEPLVLVAYLIINQLSKAYILIPAVFIGFWIYKMSEDIIELIDSGVYEKAKNKLIFPIVAALLVASRIAGVIFVISYFMI